MPIDDHHDPRLEDQLRAAPAADHAWAGARARFAVRAAADGLVDVAYEDHDTPLGSMRVSATPAGVVRVILPAEDADAALDDLARRLSPRILRASTPTLTAARKALDEYFGGTRRTFDLPLDWTLTRAFRREVLHATALIPYGETASYAQVATAAGRPKAVRAAGSALAHNPLPVLVPCHRVVRSDGALGQYLGGRAAKTELLRLEQAT